MEPRKVGPTDVVGRAHGPCRHVRLEETAAAGDYDGRTNVGEGTLERLGDELREVVEAGVSVLFLEHIERRVRALDPEQKAVDRPAVKAPGLGRDLRAEVLHHLPATDDRRQRNA